MGEEKVFFLHSHVLRFHLGPSSIRSFRSFTQIHIFIGFKCIGQTMKENSNQRNGNHNGKEKRYRSDKGRWEEEKQHPKQDIRNRENEQADVTKHTGN